MLPFEIFTCFVFCVGDGLVLSFSMPEVVVVGMNISQHVINTIRCWSIQIFQELIMPELRVP